MDYSLGNDYTGSLLGLNKFVDISGLKQNWVFGKVLGTNADIEMKIYSEPSLFGIKEGRISKLFIKDGFELLANYDRGWDVAPKTDFIALMISQMVGELVWPSWTM